MPIREDPNQQKWYSIWGLSPYMPNYYRTLFKYSKSLFLGMQRPDLIEHLDKQLIKIEQKMGTGMGYIFWVYENLPALNSFTKSLNPAFSDNYIYKHQIATWFQEIEDWVFQTLVELEPHIRFTQQRQM